MMLNWYAGWILILASFASGAVLGLRFHIEDFLGGYSSFRRRLLRLGHLALAAIGILNLVFAIAMSLEPPAPIHVASVLLVIGGATMGPLCFLTAWRAAFRHLFFIPVLSLTLAVIFVLIGGTS